MVSRKVKALRWWRNVDRQTRVIIFLAGVVLLSLLVFLQRPNLDSVLLQSNLVVFAFVNINIIFICILAFLIGRNVVKLVFDRKRQILGSKLRLKLVTAFVGLALVPTVVIYLLASGLLNQAMEGWFSAQVENSIQGSVAIAQRHYDSMSRLVKRSGAAAAIDLAERPELQSNAEALASYLQRTRTDYDLFSLSLVDQQGNELVSSKHTTAELDDFRPPQPDSKIIEQVISASADVVRGEQGGNQFIRSYTAVKFADQPAVIVATLRVSPRISEIFRQVNDSYREYEQIKLFKNPLKSGYTLTLALVTGLILFSAIWIGFYIAREISVPIQKLAEGTQAVAAGDYDFFVRTSGDDEVAFLVRSFNRMTADLKHSRKDAERRRILIEAILASLTVGVIALDKQGLVSTANQAALQMLDLGLVDAIRGQNFKKLLSADLLSKLAGILPERSGDSIRDTSQLVEDEVEFDFASSTGKRRITCATSIVRSDDQTDLGVVLILDDITDLVRAQQMEAWREVARRIAHEIKNPLTPLQLCAQRLQKLLSGSENKAVLDSTETIVEHVASIKRLADEFSKFARMPSIEFNLLDIGQLISNVVASYVDVHPHIVFRYITEPGLPNIYGDSQQLRRCLINLIDNAINAMRASSVNLEQQAVVVQATLSSKGEAIQVEVADTGPGIAMENRSRIFEPYFTTHASGTGLGLAVVSSIVADHGGSIRVFDNQPRGARMVMEIPLDGRSQRGRKIA